MQTLQVLMSPDLKFVKYLCLILEPLAKLRVYYLKQQKYEKTNHCVLFLINTLIAMGQTPEKIYPNARSNKPIQYFNEQSNLWKQETEKDPKNVQ